MKRIQNKKKAVFLAVWLGVIALLLIAIVLAAPHAAPKTETVKEVMRDGVLHEENRVRLGPLTVNPALISAYAVTAVLLLAAALLRIFAIPRFSERPGRLQTVLETAVGFFWNMANKNSPHKPRFAGAYIFSAGIYVFASTLFELFGLQSVSTSGASVALPAPLADINGAIAMGVLSYLVILAAGLLTGGVRGALGVLKDFSLPISMSFRLFGALLSGLLVTELVYYYFALSFVLPVAVGVMFTLLHALIQTYVLCTLVSIFYGEAVEPRPKKIKDKKVSVK